MFQVSFVAIIDRHLVRHPPRMKLLQLECISCRRLMEALNSSDTGAMPSESVQLYSGFWSNLFYACKFLLNFLFSPLVSVE